MNDPHETIMRWQRVGIIIGRVDIENHFHYWKWHWLISLLPKKLIYSAIVYAWAKATSEYGGNHNCLTVTIDQLLKSNEPEQWKNEAPATNRGCEENE